MNKLPSLICLALLGLLGYSTSTGQATAQADNNIVAVRQFLKKKYPGKQWQRGPTRMDSKEIRQVFGKGKFYFVFTAPPLPPGALLKGQENVFRKKMEAYRKTALTAAVHLDSAGKMTVLHTAKDFARALKPVKNEQDAQATAAAALSLFGSGRVGPGPIPADKVTVRKTDKGFQCTARPTRFYSAVAIFDAKGVLKTLSKNYTGPLPP